METKRTDEEKQAVYDVRQDKAKRDASRALRAAFVTAAIDLATAVHEYYETRQTAQWEVED